MTEFELMKNDPEGLFNLYISQMQAGSPLSQDQLVKFEYLKTVLLKGGDIGNGV